MEAEFRLSQAMIDRIGEEDAARLRDLHDSGWHVEETWRGRVVAEWEDFGVFVARETGPGPYVWSVWLHDESTSECGKTLNGALTALAVELKSTSEEITAFVGGAR
jgi:hypothetical protein